MHKLYIVESPFQLLGAMEHIYHYGKDTYVLVIRFSTENNTKQLQNMIDHFEFKNNSLKIIYGYQKSIFTRVYYEFKFLLWLFLNKNN